MKKVALKLSAALLVFVIAVSVCVSCRESMGQSDDTSVSTQPSGATTTGIYDGLDTKKYDGYLDCF